MRALVLLPLLAACAAPVAPAPPGAARPEAVTLYGDTVTVAMPDGSLCAGVREARSGPWATRLAGCPYPWAVEVRRMAGRARLPLAETAGEPWVTLTPPGARPLGYAPRRRPGA